VELFNPVIVAFHELLDAETAVKLETVLDDAANIQAIRARQALEVCGIAPRRLEPDPR
jgi:hypothetical protein